MKIEIHIKDRNGHYLELGDTIELFDWGKGKKSLGYAVLVFDRDDGRITTNPMLVEDPFDFFSKALPNCRKVL